MPNIGQRLLTGLLFFAPHIFLAIEPATGGVFPLRLAGQPMLHAGGIGEPGAIRAGIIPIDVHHGMIAALCNIRIRPLGMPPIRAAHIAPPLTPHIVLLEHVHRNILRGRREHNGAGHNFFLGNIGKLFRRNAEARRRGHLLGKGHIFCRGDKFCVLLIGHLMHAHPKTIELYRMHWSLIRGPIRPAHFECARRNPCHATGVKNFPAGGICGARIFSALFIRLASGNQNRQCEYQNRFHCFTA